MQKAKSKDNRIWAKSVNDGGKIIYLGEHTADVLKAVDELFKRVRVANEVKLAVTIAACCHDIGKVDPIMQHSTFGNSAYQPFLSDCRNCGVPHSLLSIFWMNEENIKTVLKKNKANVDFWLKIVYSAVAFHHWRDDFERIIFFGGENLRSILRKILRDGTFRERLRSNLRREFAKDVFSVEPMGIKAVELVGFNDKWANEVLEDGALIADYCAPLVSSSRKLDLFNEYDRQCVVVSGFLMRCDHFASFCEEEDLSDLSKIEIPSLDPDFVKKNVCKRLRANENDLWQLDKLKDARDKNVVLVAPTGSGKTEFAFLWSNGEKLIYTLPFRAAANQIFDRAGSIFDEDSGKRKTGLLHSDADVYLLGDGNDAENFNVCDFSRQLSFPVIVATGDQIFPHALKVPSYEKIYATMSYSRLVVDEVQAYDPKAAAVIVKFIEDATLMGGKFLLMTATLPKFVKDEIERRIKRIGSDFKVVNVYESEETKAVLKKVKKHKLSLKRIANDSDDDYLDSVVKETLAGKRVLVILNTVKRAQGIFKALRAKLENAGCANLENAIWLLHSRFTLEDRKNKENIISKEFKNPKSKEENVPKVLVSTQVVEASLDIDADVLFTEIAPFDALVQRMGRVLRRIRGEEFSVSSDNVFVWIFPDSLKVQVYDEGLVRSTLDVLKEIDLSQPLSEYDKYLYVDKLYKKIEENSVIYLDDFRDTLKFLDSGYVPERKKDAQRVFRDMIDVQVVPSGRLENLKKDLEKFLRNNRENTYVFFKENILAKYVVSAPFYLDLAEMSLEEQLICWINEKPSFDKHKRKLSRWFKNTYVVDGSYNFDVGLIVDEKNKKKNKENEDSRG